MYQNFVKRIIFKGSDGLKFDNLQMKYSMKIDLKLYERILNTIRKLKSVFKISSVEFKKCLIYCHWEFARQILICNNISSKKPISIISFQILKEIGKKNGVLTQLELSKSLKISSGEIHHHLINLIRLGFVKKKNIFLKSINNVSNILSLNPIFHDTFNKKMSIKKQSRHNFTKNFLRIFCRFNFTMEQKNLKYGIFSKILLYKKIQKKRLHRIWQKVRYKITRFGFPINDIVSRPKLIISEKEEERKEISRNKNTKIYNMNQCIFVYSQTYTKIIQNIINKFDKQGVSIPFVIEKTRGQIHYKNIQNMMKNLEKNYGFIKFNSQSGRQRILHYCNSVNKLSSVIEKLSDQKKNVKNVNLDQNIKRKKLLLKWIKNFIIPVRDLGKRVASFEDKGLRKVDSKVIRRILSDLILKGHIRIIKIIHPINRNRSEEVEYIIKKDFNLRSLCIFNKSVNITDSIFSKPNRKFKLYIFFKEKFKNLNLLKTQFRHLHFFIFHLIYKIAGFLGKGMYKDFRYKKSNFFKYNRIFTIRQIRKIIYISSKKFHERKFKIRYTTKLMPLESKPRSFISCLYFYSFEKLFIKKIIKKKNKYDKQNFRAEKILNYAYLFIKNFLFHKTNLFSRDSKNTNKKLFILVKNNGIGLYKENRPISQYVYCLNTVILKKIFRKGVFFEKKNIKWNSEIDVQLIEKNLSSKSNHGEVRYRKKKNFSSMKRRNKGLYNLSNVKIIHLMLEKAKIRVNSFFMHYSINKTTFVFKKCLEYPEAKFNIRWRKIEKLKKNLMNFTKINRNQIILFFTDYFKKLKSPDRKKNIKWKKYSQKFKNFIISLGLSETYEIKSNNVLLFEKPEDNIGNFIKKNFKIKKCKRLYSGKFVKIPIYLTEQIFFAKKFANSLISIKTALIKSDIPNLYCKKNARIDDHAHKNQNILKKSCQIRIFDRTSNYKNCLHSSSSPWCQTNCFRNINFIENNTFIIYEKKNKSFFPILKQIFCNKAYFSFQKDSKNYTLDDFFKIFNFSKNKTKIFTNKGLNSFIVKKKSLIQERLGFYNLFIKFALKPIVILDAFSVSKDQRISDMKLETINFINLFFQEKLIIAKIYLQKYSNRNILMNITNIF